MKEMIIRTLNVGETCCFYYTFRGNAAVESVFYKKNLLQKLFLFSFRGWNRISFKMMLV